MLIRKPYAFLIKNFRIIHVVLFLLSLYLGKVTLNIYDFYSSYVNLHSYTPVANLAGAYVNVYMYLAAVLMILFCSVIFYILNLKNKGTKIYVFSMIFYLALIVYFVLMTITFKKLQGATFTVETVRVYRDISLMYVLVHIVIIIFMFSRAIGFNIKQFEFKKDLEEMNIEISDSEEVELSLGNDSYKYMRTLRKLLRLTKYFILENKLFVIVLSSILIFAISLSMFRKLDVYSDKKFEEGQFFANNISFSVSNSYITQVDMNNIIINKNKYYLIINMNMTNNTVNDIQLDRESFRLELKDELLYPDMTLEKKFFDLGKIYKKFKLKSGISDNYYIIFEIDKSNLSSEYVLRTLTNTKEGYKDSLIKPINLDVINDNGSKTVPNAFTFKDSLLKNTTLTFSEYRISDKFMEKYAYEINGENKTGIYTVMPDIKSIGKMVVLRIDSNIEVDKESYLSNYIKKPSDFYKYYAFLKYSVYGEEYELKLEPIKNIYEIDKYSYFEVPTSLQYAEKIEINLLIRGQKYTFNLK